MANTGFYTLSSRSGSYVENKRDDDGQLEYQGAENAIGIERQRALQDLSANYDQTINNAFASYLAGQRAIRGSNMGQGFKNQYLQMQQENTLAQIASANQTAANLRQEINTAASEAQSAVQTAKLEEINNMDRALDLMNDYREYVNSLTNKDNESVYDEEQQAWDIKYLYSDLFNLDPKDFFEDEERKVRGKSYAEWLHDTLGEDEADLNFGNWLYYNQGLENLGKMIERSRVETPYETRDKWRQENIVNDYKYNSIEFLKPAEKEEVMNAYNIPQLLKEGYLNKDDIIKYNDNYYIVTSNGSIEKVKFDKSVENRKDQQNDLKRKVEEDTKKLSKIW